MRLTTHSWRAKLTTDSGVRTQSALLCVTSSVEVAFTFATQVAILKDGVIAGQGTWDELHALGDPWVTNFLDVREFKPSAQP